MHEIREDCGTAKPLKRVLTSQLTASGATTAAVAVEEAAEEAKEGAVDKTTLTAQLTATLFPVLIEIYSASAGPGVKHAALQVESIIICPSIYPLIHTFSIYVQINITYELST